MRPWTPARRARTARTRYGPIYSFTPSFLLREQGSMARTCFGEIWVSVLQWPCGIQDCMRPTRPPTSFWNSASAGRDRYHSRLVMICREGREGRSSDEVIKATRKMSRGGGMSQRSLLIVHAEPSPDKLYLIHSRGKGRPCRSFCNSYELPAAFLFA